AAETIPVGRYRNDWLLYGFNDGQFRFWLYASQQVIGPPANLERPFPRLAPEGRLLWQETSDTAAGYNVRHDENGVPVTSRFEEPGVQPYISGDGPITADNPMKFVVTDQQGAVTEVLTWPSDRAGYPSAGMLWPGWI